MFQPPGKFITHLVDKREIPRHRAAETGGGYEIHYLDLSVLKLNASLITPFVSWSKISGHSQITIDQLTNVLPDLAERTRQVSAPFMVFVVGSTIRPTPPPDLVQQFGRKSVVVLDSSVMDRVIAAPDRATAWRELASPIVKYLGIDKLSPYQPGRPAFGGRFFGRLDYLNRALSGKQGGNITILGNRRIGKTSLLNELRLRMVNDNENLRTASVYGSKCHSTYDVCKEIMEHLRPDIAYKMTTEPHIIDNLPAHISLLPEKRNEDVAVFIDEADHLLEFDSRQEYALMHLLRASFEHDRCRVFFAGFRRVMEAKNRLDTPLYNFTQALYLEGLNKSETINMITEPLARLGIQVPDSLPTLILSETNGRPDLVQLFCSKVIEYYRNNGRPPEPETLIEEMLKDPLFTDAVYTTFIKNTNAAERLVCFALIRQAETAGGSIDDYLFRLKDMDIALKHVGARLTLGDLETLSANLQTGGIIAPLAGRRVRQFKFAMRRLPDFCVRTDLDFLIEKTREDYESTPGGIDLLLESAEEISMREVGFDGP